MRKEGSILSSDGVRISYRAWMPAVRRAVVLAIHGLGAHSGFMENLGVELMHRSIGVVAPDLQGHGRSGGTLSVDGMLGDLKIVSEEFGATHLLGHSLGASLAMLLGAELDVGGVVLMAPPVKGGRGQIGDLIWRLKIFVMSRLKPDSSVDILEWRRRELEESPYGKAILGDPLFRRSFTYRELAEISSITGRRMLVFAERLRRPVLILHGVRDTVSDLSGSVQLLRRLASHDKRLKPLEGVGHTFGGLVSPIQMKLPSAEAIVKELESWIKRRSVSH